MLNITAFTCDYRAADSNEAYGFIEVKKPQLSWALEASGNDVYQTSYHIIVSADGHVVWDSGVIECDRSTFVPYDGEALMPFTKYACHLTVTATNGCSAIAQTEFETGRLNTPFEAKWIYSGKKNNPDSTDPIHTFRGSFAFPARVTQARLFVSAMGMVEVQFDGKRVSDDYFVPGNCDCKTHIQYVEYDVTRCIKGDSVTVTADIANGWYLGRVDYATNYYGDARALLLELRVKYSDGTSGVFVSDKSWQYADDGATRFAEIYDGEIYDARMTPTEFRPCKLLPAAAYTGKKIIAHLGVPVKTHEAIMPVNVFKNSKGEKVFDLGQNFAGIVHIKTNAPAGTVITVSHAELFMDGDIYNENYRYAKAQLIYTCRGGGEEYQPRFTYMGFRYVKVTGTDDIELLGLPIHSCIPKLGTFECSNALVNQLQSNIDWGERSNFVDIPTDCPQRDERLGWTGDITVFAPTAAFNRDIALFMRKWLYDLESEQENGVVPFCIPDVGCLKKEKTPTTGWSDAATMVPWAVYMSNGDSDLLRRQYNSMKAWVDCETRCCNEKLIWREGFQFGDWLAPDGPFKLWTSRAPWLASCYFANSASILSRAAGILGKKNDEKKYAELCTRIKKAFVDEFINSSGSIEDGFQSAYVCALWFDMLNDEQRERAIRDLENDIKEHNGMLNTGFLGTPYLTFALSDNGKADIAYKLLLNERCPSWLYPVKLGATTVWERWDGIREDGTIHIYAGGKEDNMVSFNHYAYGAVGDWLYKRVAGLDILQAGYKVFSVAPHIGGGMTYAKATHISPYGKIGAGWNIEGANVVISVTVPVNTTAVVTMPSGKQHKVGSGEHEFTEAYRV